MANLQTTATQAPIVTFRTSADIAASLDDTSNSTTSFSSLNQAVSWQDTLQPANPEADATIPTISSKQRQHVAVLVQAVKSTATARDNDAVLKPYRDARHDERLVEVACWRLLHAMIRRSMKAGPLQTMYGIPTKPSADIAFAERFDATVQALADKKTLCKGIIDPPAIIKLVDDPLRRLAKAEENQRGNLKKRDLLTRAAGLRKTKSKSPASALKRDSFAAFDEEDAANDGDTEESSGRGIKRCRTMDAEHEDEEVEDSIQSGDLGFDSVESIDDTATGTAVQDEDEYKDKMEPVASHSESVDAEVPEEGENEFGRLLQQFLEERNNQ